MWGCVAQNDSARPSAVDGARSVVPTASPQRDPRLDRAGVGQDECRSVPRPIQLHPGCRGRRASAASGSAATAVERSTKTTNRPGRLMING